MKEATTRPIGVIDSAGTVIASSELSLVGTYIGVFTASSEESSDKTVKSFGRTFRFIGGTGSQYDYAVFVDGEDEYAKTVCIMAYIAICEAKTSNVIMDILGQSISFKILKCESLVTMYSAPAATAQSTNLLSSASCSISPK